MMRSRISQRPVRAAPLRSGSKIGVAARIPFHASPMLATLVSEPFHREDWVYEEKYDGYRILAYKEGDRVRLISRNDLDRTARFPSVAAAVSRLRATTLLLDGEVVVFDSDGVSRFQLLQQGREPQVYAVFDCLYANGIDLRRLPLAARRAALEKHSSSSTHLRLARRLPSNGLAAYRTATRLGMEGLVAKDVRSPYVEGRSRSWVKVKVHAEDEFVIGGYTDPAGSRSYFGALLLGAYDARGDLRYVGRVGTGFSVQSLARLHGVFQRLVRATPAFADPPSGRGVTWLVPRLVAQIGYQEWTADLRLRQPRFLGMRDDKPARQVRLPARPGGHGGSARRRDAKAAP